jgi:hypothetical protein
MVAGNDGMGLSTDGALWLSQIAESDVCQLIAAVRSAGARIAVFWAGPHARPRRQSGGCQACSS